MGKRFFLYESSNTYHNSTKKTIKSTANITSINFTILYDIIKLSKILLEIIKKTLAIAKHRKTFNCHHNFFLIFTQKKIMQVIEHNPNRQNTPNGSSE